MAQYVTNQRIYRYNNTVIIAQVDRITLNVFSNLLSIGSLGIGKAVELFERSKVSRPVEHASAWSDRSRLVDHCFPLSGLG